MRPLALLVPLVCLLRGLPAPAAPCPVNPDGGPNVMTLHVDGPGSDLDLGWTGTFHSLALPSGGSLDVCLSGCSDSQPSCSIAGVAEASTGTGAGLPPLPTLVANVPLCLMADVTGAAGMTDLGTGAIDATAMVGVHGFLTQSPNVCPQCLRNRCDASSARAGRACVVDAEPTVPALHKDFAVSRDCPPRGSAVIELPLSLPLTTGDTSLLGPLPCSGSGQVADDICSGTCSATCTGEACAALDADGACIDFSGGVSQTCCSDDTTRSCFPSASDSGGVLQRQGRAGVPGADPDDPLRRTAHSVVASTFCVDASASTLIDTLAGLPGPGAVLAPVTVDWGGPPATGLELAVRGRARSVRVGCRLTAGAPADGTVCEAVATAVLDGARVAITPVVSRPFKGRTRRVLSLPLTPTGTAALLARGSLPVRVDVTTGGPAGSLGTGSALVGLGH